MSSDERLARRAAQGEARAFEAIYNRYQQDLYRFCLAMVGNPQDAQDALQNTMVKVLRALPGEKRRIQLKPWLYRIARNESVETLRKRRDSEELDAESGLGAVAGVAEVAETRARLRTLIADLEELPQRQRAVLVMRELAGLDFAEIGEAFETSPAVARQTLYEARLSLRQLEEGREMRCADVMRELSDADGRVTRRREIRAHLRSCPDCRAFRESMVTRREDLAALAPLPLAASAALLQGVLGGAAAASGAAGAGGAGGGAIAATVGAGAGKAVATSTIVKSVATVAVAAVVGASAADRGGLVDLPLAGSDAPESAGESGGSVVEGAPGPPNAGHAAKGEQQGNSGSGGEDGQAKGGKPGKQSGGKSGSTRSDGSSRPQAGLPPPGGGHGRSASEERGRPEGLPDAARRGQGTAAARKPSHAASPPGQSRIKPARSSGGGGSPPAKPAPSSKAKAQPPRPKHSAETAPKAKGGRSSREPAPGAAPGLEP